MREGIREGLLVKWIIADKHWRKLAGEDWNDPNGSARTEKYGDTSAMTTSLGDISLGDRALEIKIDRQI